MPRTSWGWEITRQELSQWTLYEDAQLLVLNKPAHVVCHPSKWGPGSSLAGACREYLGLRKVHMPSRLDRETSGVVVVAKSYPDASRLQRAVQRRQVRKVYHAILTGELRGPVRVDQPNGKAPESAVSVRRAVVPGGAAAITDFEPLACRLGLTLVRVIPHTGRNHQIRVHAQWLGHPVAGDKLYGPDETLFLEFLEFGWTERHAALLPLDSQALHAS